MNFHDEVVELLKKTAVRNLGCDISTLSGATRFEEDLHCKSVDIVRFTAILEDEYEVEVPFMGFKRNKTFDEAADYLCELTGYI